jgi:hypothetical protein
MVSPGYGGGYGSSNRQAPQPEYFSQDPVGNVEDASEFLADPTSGPENPYPSSGTAALKQNLSIPASGAARRDARYHASQIDSSIDQPVSETPGLRDENPIDEMTAQVTIASHRRSRRHGKRKAFHYGSMIHSNLI